METPPTVEWPEGEEPGLGLDYDPESPESILHAREALRDRLGLAFLPILCSEPQRPRRLLSRLRLRVGRFLRGRP